MDSTNDGTKQERREIKFLSYAVYVCDGYKRVGFITRWDAMDFATSLNAQDWHPFTAEEVWRVHEVLNFHGITHFILAMSDTTWTR